MAILYCCLRWCLGENFSFVWAWLQCRCSDQNSTVQLRSVQSGSVQPQWYQTMSSDYDFRRWLQAMSSDYVMLTGLVSALRFQATSMGRWCVENWRAAVKGLRALQLAVPLEYASTLKVRSATSWCATQYWAWTEYCDSTTIVLQQSVHGPECDIPESDMTVLLVTVLVSTNSGLMGHRVTELVGVGHCDWGLVERALLLGVLRSNGVS